MKSFSVFYKEVEGNEGSKVKIPIISICEDVDEHYKYWTDNFNPNKEDCCNLRR